MKKLIILILVLTALVSVNAFSQEQTPPSTKGQTQSGKFNSKASEKSNIQTKKNERIPTENKSSLSKHDPIKQDAAANYSKNEANGGQGLAVKDDPISRYTFWLMVFTACLVVCNILLWIYTKKAADAAKESANTLHVIEKAYIIVTATPGKPVIFGEDIVDVTIWNDGRTPATIIKCKAIVLSKKDVVNMDGSDILPRTELGGNRNHLVSIRIMGDRVQGAQRGIEIYCHALVEYEDIFRDRYTKRYTWKNESDISRPYGYWVSCDNTELEHYT